MGKGRMWGLISIIAFAIVAGCLDPETIFDNMDTTEPGESQDYKDTIETHRDLCAKMTMDTLSIAMDPKYPGTCFPKTLEWSAADPSEGCEDCGQVVESCELFLELVSQETPTCPEWLYEGLSEADRARYLAEMEVESGQTASRVLCVVPKVATPLDCDDADAFMAELSEDLVGWRYCEGGAKETGCPSQLSLTPATAEMTEGEILSLRCLDRQALSDDDCDVTPESELGSVCTQPGFEPAPNLLRNTYTLSFQHNCDCMTVESVTLPDGTAVNHFCTQPCGGADCPSGYQCVNAFLGGPGLGESVDQHYCVPDCLVDGCAPDMTCATSTEAESDWHCVEGS